MIAICLRNSAFVKPGWVSLIVVKWAINQAMQRGISEPVPFIDDACKQGKLTPRDSSTFAILRNHYGYGSGLINFAELVAWGHDLGYDFHVQAVTSAPKVGGGETAAKVKQVETAQEQPGGEPFLSQNHKNCRDAIRKWVHWQAWALVKTDDTAATLVERIWQIADSSKYGSERSKNGEPMTRATILKELPPEVTGGRGKNKGRSKAGWPDFGKGGKATTRK